MSSIRRLGQVHNHLAMDELPTFDQLPNFKDFEGMLEPLRLVEIM